MSIPVWWPLMLVGVVLIGACDSADPSRGVGQPIKDRASVSLGTASLPPATGAAAPSARMAAPPVSLSRVIDNAEPVEVLDVGELFLVEDLPAEESAVIDEIGEPRDAGDPGGGDSDSAQSSPIAIGEALSADAPSWADPESTPTDIEPHSLGESLDADVPWIDPVPTLSPTDIGEPLEVSPLR